MSYLKINVFLLLVVCTFIACGGNTGQKQQGNSTSNLYNDKTRLENINRYLTEKDKDIIESYIRRQGWKMQFSPDGYFYEIYNTGNNPKASEGNEVECEITISLLNGTVCHKSTEPKNFLVGRSEEISGMHLAITHLGKGGKAKFIFPPQLAHGLQGDMNKIPPRSVVVYDVEVTDIK
ncbi:MAG: FKBP-type peptidyl-prolyl cis-trans isomerase [Prevotellaceae bacterium]|jgi:FKBP-type peptidyl-prolyl cis-trans isomerase|nr:FKBP-type peptidyl-prolyl cis-trans isomerase [Prevotellaceae bacterium]